MAREHLLTVLGILSLVACSVSQTAAPPTTHKSNGTIDMISLPGNIGNTGSTQPITNRPTNNTGGGSKNSSVPKIQDQTAQTFTKLESAISNETELLANVYKDFKTTMAEALKNLSKIEQSKLDVRPVSNEMNSMSTTVGTAFEAADKRLKASLLTVGRSMNTSIASFVKSEQGYIGKMKLAPDARSISKELRQVENNLYRGLGTCLSTFNGSAVSDIFTARNMFNTYFMTIDTFVNGVAGCSTAANCAALSRTLLTQLVSWKGSTTGTFNKIPNIGELNACITSQATTAKNDLANLGRTIQPSVDSRAVITNQTAILETNAKNLFGNFSKNVQKQVNGVLDKINHIQTFASTNVRDDPKSIIDSNFKVVTTGDDVTVKLMETVLPRLTTVSRRLIVPLFNKETKIQGQIEANLAKNSSLSSECDTAIETIFAIKNTFNNSMIGCFNGTHDSTDAILAATAGMINGSLVTFTSQIASAEQFNCGQNCTTTAMQAFAQQLRSKLEVGATLLAELRKSVTEQTNRVYTAFESCMDGNVQKALGSLNEQTNTDIKHCLASA